MQKLKRDVLFADYIDMLPEYLGPAGAITPLHHYLTNNFMTQVRGRKDIKLIAAFNSRMCITTCIATARST